MNEDGTTDGGCRDVPIIAADDTSGEGCPTGQWSDDEKLALGLLVGSIVGGVVLLCCCVVCLVIFFCKKKKKKMQPYTQASPKRNDTSTVPAPRP